MKKYLLIIFIPIVIACQQNTKGNQQETAATDDILEEKSPSFNWLVANWVRVNEEAGQITSEQWTKEKDNHYKGWGYTLAGEDTVFQEHMNLIGTNGNWQLEVRSSGGELATVFKMSEHTDGSFTVENPQHDFPTKIFYFIKSDTLKAEVSNAEMHIAFDFIPIQ
jgi:hypothetical protein